MRNLNLSVLSLALVLAAVAAVADPGEKRQLTPKPEATFKLPDGRTLELELLGRPLPAKKSPVEFVTTSADGEKIAWAVSRATIEHVLLGCGEKSGLHKLDLSEYFGPHSYKPTLNPGGDSVYILAGNRGPALIKYHIPSKKATVLRKYETRYYYLGTAVDSKGRIYWATYPETEVIGVDPADDRVFSLGRMTTEKKQSYALSPAIDDADILYVPVGESYPQLFAYNLATGAKKQLFSDADIKALQQKSVRIPRVTLQDGKVYTRIGAQIFRCTPEGLQEAPEIKLVSESNRPNAKYPSCKFNDRETALYFDENGLVLNDGKSSRTIPLEGLPVVGHELYAIGDSKDGVLYGSGIFPANSFGLNLKTLESTDFGMGSRGGVQNYDLAATPYGILMASYVGSYFDLLDPAKPIKPGVNPKPIGDLRKEEQERPIRLTKIGDGKILYVGTIPAKNTHGGVIARIDLEKGEIKSWRNVIPDQSIMDLVEVPDGGGLLFGGSCVDGGTGSEPKAKEAAMFLFDPATGKTVWTASPLPGARAYQGSSVTSDGKIMIVGRGEKMYRFYLFDPVKREIVKDEELPGQYGTWIFAEKKPVGPDGNNYFLARGALFEYSAKTGKLTRLFEHPSLKVTGYTAVAPDGCLYYLNECRLYRVRLFQP